MSETPKRPYAQVMRVAEVLVDSLRIHCHRIAIAGSLRRKRPMCGDVEIVAVPILHTDLIGDPLDTSEVDDWLARSPVTLHKNGNKYKQFSFEWQPRMWFKVDLFLQPDPATWGWNYMVRTGSKEFSHRMVIAKSYGGHKPDWATIDGARVWRNGKALDTSEESKVFDLWGMDFIEPENRA